jgi:hypothetical protein
LYASTGSALPSPTSYSNSPSSSSSDYFTLSSPSYLTQSASPPPLTPSAASLPTAGTMWPTQTRLHTVVPALQMPRNRLKTALNAVDNIEFIEHENLLMRKLMTGEVTSLSSPSNRLAGVNPANLENIFGSSTQSPTPMQSHQNTNHQLWGYPSDLTNSNVIGSPQLRVDAITKRSESFIERTSVASFKSLCYLTCYGFF